MSSFSWFVKCYVLKEPKHLILKVKTITTHTPRRSTFRIALNKFSCTLELDKFTPMLITNTQTEVKKKKLLPNYYLCLSMGRTSYLKNVR